MGVSQELLVLRPRERLLAGGAGSLSDAELLAVLLRTGTPRCSASALAEQLLQRFGTLSGVLAAPRAEFMAVAGLGEARYAELQAACELARRQALETMRRRDVLSSPDLTRRFLAHHLGLRRREIFCGLFLDSQHAVLHCEDLFLGTLDAAAVYPREVARRSLELGAAAIIFAHNHPSGVVEPSDADRRITQRLQAALALFDIRVLDHIIVGQGCHFSFAERGLL
jgi:DNA repair protein RadC